MENETITRACYALERDSNAAKSACVHRHDAEFVRSKTAEAIGIDELLALVVEVGPRRERERARPRPRPPEIAFARRTSAVAGERQQSRAAASIFALLPYEIRANPRTVFSHHARNAWVSVHDVSVASRFPS